MRILSGRQHDADPLGNVVHEAKMDKHHLDTADEGALRIVNRVPDTVGYLSVITHRAQRR